MTRPARRTLLLPLLLPLLLLGACPRLRAQEPQPTERVVPVSVTASSERSVYLDHGRDVGLRPGSIVRLFPQGAPLEVEVRSVSHTSARAEVPPGLPLPPVGTQGEARVDVEPSPPHGPQPPRQVPPHPPWTRAEERRDADQPLLVPTFRQRPDARPATLDGRVFGTGQWSRDSAGGRDSEYLLARLGVRADATNTLGAAERIRVAGELDERTVDVADAADERDTNARLDLASVAFGTEQWAPTGIEIGRFLSTHLPEIGLVDGVELVRRFQGGYRLGGGLGAYPRPFPVRDTGDDVGVHAFADYAADAARSFALALGVQKTWHRGAPDRDLVLLRAEARPAARLRLFASAKVDLYSGSDQRKDRSVELTELLGAAHWDGRDAGAGLTVSHFAWPDLKREEYENLPLELVRAGEVDRVSASGWHRPADWLRLQLRGDAFQDQDRDGSSYGADAELRGPLGQGSALALSWFETDGAATSGPGARALLRARLGDGSWRAGYRWHRYELSRLVTGPESYTRQSAELGLSLPLGAATDLDASLERWFGDREDAWSFHLHLQWRF
jgi:hypothetical protein